MEKSKGKQRDKYKSCSLQFTRLIPRGRPAQEKAMTVTLYTQGLSIRVIARLIGVSPTAVLKWIKSFAKTHYEKTAPGDAICVELDEMWHYLKSKVIAADKLYQSKSQTVYLEQNNGRQRHWFARFRRKSIVVFKTLEMVDLTMALFAKFHVSGSWEDIAIFILSCIFLHE